MSSIERRQVPRTSLDKLAYIHIEPNNGGIILNISDVGLGFHSMAPVENDGPLHFSLKEHNRRIDVCGELIWTDEVQKIGGLRFTTLTNEAREQLASWTSPGEPEAGAASTLGSAFLRVFPTLSVRKLVPKIQANERFAPLKTKVRLRLSGFSGGLATGLLISMLAMLIFMFSYAHRQQFGESLIRLGEHLASKPARSTPAQQAQQADSPVVRVPQTLSASPMLPVRSPAPAAHREKAETTEFQDVVQILPPAAPKNSDGKSRSDGRAEHVAPKLLPNNLAEPLKRIDVAKETTPTNGTQPLQRITPPNTGEVASTVPTSTAPPSASPAARSGPSDNAPGAREPRGPVQAESLSSAPALPLQRFFDLGKFKQQQVAQDLSDRVAQLGMRASVVNKGHLWMNSYQVLVGPYLTEREESKIHTDLTSNGITARPFERGSRGFAFRSALTVAGSRLPVGDLNISWETYVSEAKVKFTQEGASFASADARWVPHPQKFAHNEYVYENAGGNSRSLLEVHFAGSDRVLVFK